MIEFATSARLQHTDLLGSIEDAQGFFQMLTRCGR